MNYIITTFPLKRLGTHSPNEEIKKYDSDNTYKEVSYIKLDTSPPSYIQ